MMDMSTVRHEAYERLYGRTLDSFGAEGLVLRHKKSGARVCLCASDNTNKVFSIAFRTPPQNDTGVAHIMEHSVLSGSEKYPLKDPFNELCKGSFQTYLNASTYPDMTSFPVASTNDKDFRNLVDVYLDAVFHPNIYHNEMIFRQEGWRYHLGKMKDPLRINGVVYSEMKGSFADAETLLYQTLRKNLFQGTPYGFCSGGDPDCIPDLSYEEFLDFHRRYYHPSNAYIFLYGDMDMVEYLDYLDRDYLGKYEARAVDAELPKHKFRGIIEKEIYYPIGAKADDRKRAYFAWASLADMKDSAWNCAVSAVLYTVIGVPGAPIRKALFDAGICEDVDYYCEKDREQFYYVIAKGADPARQKEFNEIFKREAERLYREGLNHKTILGFLKTGEYDCREGRTKKASVGMALMNRIRDFWLYDDDKAFDNCDRVGVYKKLMALLDTGYFEEVLREIFLNCDAEMYLLMKPKKGLATDNERKLAEKLAAYKETLSEQQLRQMAANTAALKVYQETPDSPETLAMIPHLKISDINREPEDFPCEKLEKCGVPVLYHEGKTYGIVYLRLAMDITDLPKEELAYVSLMNSIFLRMNTKTHTYQELSDEVMMHTGSFYSTFTTHGCLEDYHRFTGMSVHKCNALAEEMPTALELLREMLCETDFSDKKRLFEVIKEDRNYVRSNLVYDGNAVAKSQCSSHLHASEYFDYCTVGYGQYNALVEWQEHFNEQADEIIAHLNRVLAFCLDRKRFMITINSDRENLEKVMSLLPDFLAGIDAAKKAEAVKPADKLPWEGGYPLGKKNEAITYSGNMNFWFAAGSFKEAGFKHSGLIQLVAQIISRNYLYQNIRVKGGAYGCGISVSGSSGLISTYTYRDPNLRNSLDIIRGIPKYVENLDISEEELTKAIIGGMSESDRPKSAEAEGDTAVGLVLTDITLERRRKGRNEVLNATPEKLRAQAPIFQAMINNMSYACFVSEDMVKENTDLFDAIIPSK